MDISVLPSPRRCFCQIATEELRHWARLKYLQHVPTLELLGLAKDRQEKEAVGIVALLDVPDDDVIRTMRPLSQSRCNVLACRDHVRDWLRDMLGFPGEPDTSRGR